MSMEPTKVVLFRSFREDRRLSQDHYANCLRNALLRMADASIDVREFTPTPLDGSELTTRWRMRASRYWIYPGQARHQQQNVNHILDHSYGHLLYVLDENRTIVTVHDIIPLLAWRRVIASNGIRHRPLLAEFSLRAIKRAACIVAVSARTRDDLVEHLGFPSEKIRVVHHGVSTAFRPLDALKRRQARAALALPQDAKLILISGWQYYKNHGKCAEAFRKLSQTIQHELWLVRLGCRTAEWQEIASKHRITDRVIHFEWLEQDQLVHLYNTVDILLFPSLYEGFGWPALEAMACGTPVVCSNTGSLPEIVGRAALTTAPTDVDSMVQGIIALLYDEEKRRHYITLGLEQVKKFSWERCAREVRAIYDKVSAGT